MAKEDVFDVMVQRWPSAIVTRTAVKDFTGGLVTDKYLALLAGKGLGPKQVKIGRKVAYPAKDFAAWLRDKTAKGGLNK